MTKQEEKEMENIQLEPNWQTWENIEKQYEGKHLILGCSDNQSLTKIKSSVIIFGDTDEEITNFWLKNKKKVKTKNNFTSFAFVYIMPKNAPPPIKVITSVRKITSEK